MGVNNVGMAPGIGTALRPNAPAPAPYQHPMAPPQTQAPMPMGGVGGAGTVRPPPVHPGLGEILRNYQGIR